MGMYMTQFFSDIKALLAVVNLDRESPQLVHYCYVTADSHEHQVDMKPIGSRCCSSREQSVEQVVVPILDYFFGQSWDVAAVSRWVHVSKLLKRFFIGCLAADLLPHALRDLKAHGTCPTPWNVL